jgi:beta-galactosidase
MAEVHPRARLCLYETELLAEDRVVSVAEIRDRAVVLADGVPVGTLSRSDRVTCVPLPASVGSLGFLVEDQGRVDYGPHLGEAKGLIGPVRTAVRRLDRWRVRPLDVEAMESEVSAGIADLAPIDPGVGLAGPVWAYGEFAAQAGADLHLRLDGWTKGLAWVNGFLLGRYWCQGPTQTLYVPGPVVRQHNHLTVLEYHSATASRVQFVDEPILGPVRE